MNRSMRLYFDRWMNGIVNRSVRLCFDSWINKMTRLVNNSQMLPFDIRIENGLNGLMNRS